MNFVELNGVALRYELSGKGDRTIVATPGGEVWANSTGTSAVPQIADDFVYGESRQRWATSCRVRRSKRGLLNHLVPGA